MSWNDLLEVFLLNITNRYMAELSHNISLLFYYTNCFLFVKKKSSGKELNKLLETSATPIFFYKLKKYL